MISTILSIISVIVLYSYWFSFDISTITNENVSSFLLMIIPTAIIGGIGGLLGLIGAVLFLIGRKEFGEKHSQFVMYALIVFVISIIVSVIIVGVTMFSTFSSLGFSSISPGISNIENIYRSTTMTSMIITPISAALGGLIWIFALYQLEDDRGRLVLYSAFCCTVITSIVVSYNSMMLFEEMISSGAFNSFNDMSTFGSSTSSQLLSNYQWIGSTAIYSLIGGSVTNILLFFALFIPYKRITSGELVPIQQPSSSFKGTEFRDRKCPNCGRPIPFDANNCPYCGKKFESFV